MILRNLRGGFKKSRMKTLNLEGVIKVKASLEGYYAFLGEFLMSLDLYTVWVRSFVTQHI